MIKFNKQSKEVEDLIEKAKGKIIDDEDLSDQ